MGNGGKNKSGASVLLHGVQVTEIAENTWSQSAPITINHTVGEPRTKVVKNQFDSDDRLKIQELNSQEENTALIYGNEFLEGE